MDILFFKRSKYLLFHYVCVCVCDILTTVSFTVLCTFNMHAIFKVKVKSLSRVRLFETPWTVAHTRLLRPWDSPGKNTGVGCHFLLQCNI